MGNRIKKLRDEKNMTQVRLGTELGIAQENISAYERERSYPGVLTLIKMSRFFDASIDYILGLSDIRKPVANETLSIDELRLIEQYRALPKNKKDIALAFILGQQDTEKL